MLKGKRILLGVTGSIAAYKTANLVRLFVKAGAEVKVIMTKAAAEFITPLTLSTLSKHSVDIDFVQNKRGEWVNHVNLGISHDLMIIAPASANTIAKMATGLCDNLLLATYLSARCPVMIAPAMDLDMLKHRSTQLNLDKLVTFGNIIIPSGNGELASGLHGEGRMAEPEEILIAVEKFFSSNQDLKGKKILITAGPTHEKIDPVRYIGNYSSGKMGFALAEEVASRGAEVVLITGPTTENSSNPSINRINILSASDMYREVLNNFSDCDSIIMAAAVADYTPENPASVKIKKENNLKAIELVPTIDILVELGKLKKEKQILIGFALETDKELENAKKKLERKNLDFIVLNSLNERGAGFQHNTNKVSIISRSGEMKEFGLKSKTEVAKDIIDTCLTNLK